MTLSVVSIEGHNAKQRYLLIKINRFLYRLH